LVKADLTATLVAVAVIRVGRTAVRAIVASEMLIHSTTLAVLAVVLVESFPIRMGLTDPVDPADLTGAGEETVVVVVAAKVIWVVVAVQPGAAVAATAAEVRLAATKVAVVKVARVAPVAAAPLIAFSLALTCYPKLFRTPCRREPEVLPLLVPQLMVVPGAEDGGTLVKTAARVQPHTTPLPEAGMALSPRAAGHTPFTISILLMGWFPPLATTVRLRERLEQVAKRGHRIFSLE